jgi:hypothetical protein
MLDEHPAECGDNRDLLNGILEEMRRLADQLDTIARAEQARLAEYLGAFNPRPGAKSDGRLSSGSGLSETLLRRISS